MASRRFAAWVLGALLCLGAAHLLQNLGGNTTIYRPGVQPARLKLHRAIIYGAPDDNWNALGANSVSRRVIVPWTVELLHRATGRRIEALYRDVATVCLALCLGLFFVLLRRWHPPAWALAGTFVFSAIVLGTYSFHYFHPWDRPGLAVWLAFYLAAVSERFKTSATLLAFGMFIKFDLLFAPFLYLGLHGRPALKKSAALLAITVSVFVGLRWMRPEQASTPLGPLALIVRNFQHILEFNMNVLSVAVLGLLVIFAAIAARRAPKPALVLGLFGAAHIPLFYVQSNFRELRAMTFIVAALMPLALLGVRQLVSRPSAK